MKLNRNEWAVFLFTLAYMLWFTARFLMQANYEFVIYVLTVVILMGLVGWNLRRAEFPVPMLWALTLWGLAHMAGGGIRVGDGVLYSMMLVPIAGSGEFAVLKYDQIVHAWGFGVTAWVLWHLLVVHFPVLRSTKTVYVFPALAAMGLGAVNEIIEFIAVVTVPDTNVGGYYNTALDLVFNATGAVVAMWVVARVERRKAAQSA